MRATPVSPSTASTSLVIVKGSSGPSRSASQMRLIASMPRCGSRNGAVRYVASGSKSSSTAAVPGERQARS